MRSRRGNATDTCRRVERLTLEAAAGSTLTEPQRELIASHLAECATCHAEAAVAELLLDEDGLGASLPLDELTERRVLNAVMDGYEEAHVRQPKQAPTAARRLRRRLRPGLVAAAVVLALVGAGVGIGVYRALNRSSRAPGVTRSAGTMDGARIQLSTGQVQVDAAPVVIGQAVLPGQTLRVRQGRTALTLPARSAVMLERHSTVRVDRLSKASTALTLQRGSLLASITPRAGRPRFTVQTRAGRIEVTGTVFWVESTSERVVVAVLRGAVRVVEPGRAPRLVRSGQRSELGVRPLGPDRRAAAPTRAIDADDRNEAWRWVRALELVTAPGTSALTIRTRPAGALVLVDELLLGETPLTSRLSSGYHRLELRKPGYAPVVQWIAVPSGKPLEREVALTSLLARGPDGRHGSLIPGPAAGAAGATADVQHRHQRRSRPPWAYGDPRAEPDDSGADQGSAAARRPAMKPDGDANATPKLPTAKALVTRARGLRAKHDFRGAAAVFRELIRRYPGHARSHMARVSLGLILLDELKDPRGALQQFSRYLARSQVGALAPEAAYGRIRALRRLGRGAAEIRRLKQFLQQYPRAVYANAVRSRLRKLGVAPGSQPLHQMGLGGTRGVK